MSQTDLQVFYELWYLFFDINHVVSKVLSLKTQGKCKISDMIANENVFLRILLSWAAQRKVWKCPGNLRELFSSKFGHPVLICAVLIMLGVHVAIVREILRALPEEQVEGVRGLLSWRISEGIRECQRYPHTLWRHPVHFSDTLSLRLWHSCSLALFIVLPRYVSSNAFNTIIHSIGHR